MQTTMHVHFISRMGMRAPARERAAGPGHAGQQSECRAPWERRKGRERKVWLARPSFPSLLVLLSVVGCVAGPAGSSAFFSLSFCSLPSFPFIFIPVQQKRSSFLSTKPSQTRSPPPSIGPGPRESKAALLASAHCHSRLVHALSARTLPTIGRSPSAATSCCPLHFCSVAALCLLCCSHLNRFVRFVVVLRAQKWWKEERLERLGRSRVSSIP